MQVAPTTIERQPSSLGERMQHAHSSLDLWALGITIVIGGQFFSWHAGLAAGCIGFGVAVLLVGIAYICLACSMAEMTSMLPFAGGVYGLTRCTLGFYAGFVLGCCEILEYVCYVASVNVALGRTVSLWWNEWTPYQPFVWLISHLISLGLTYVGGKLFWRFNLFLALALVFQILVFVFGSIQFADVEKYTGGSSQNFIGGFSQWLTSLPMAMWFYVGIEALNTLCNEVDDPRRTIPKGQVSSMITMFLTSIGVYMIAIIIPPGLEELQKELAIFDYGYSLILNIPVHAATLYSIPASFASTPGFLLASSNILSALSDSSLIPIDFHTRHSVFNTPVRAVLCTTTMSFILCFCVLYAPETDTILYYLSMIFATMAYTSQCVGYIYLKKRYKTIPRSFESPFGISGALFSMTVFGLCFVSLLGFQPEGDAITVISILISILITLSVYYHGYAKDKQTFSEDERKILFFAHIANNNNAKSKRKKNQNVFRRVLGLTSKITSITGTATSIAPSRHSTSGAPVAGDLIQSKVK